MSSQIIQLPDRASQPADDTLGPIREKVGQARRDRARLEPVWHSNRAFAAGKQWLKWSRFDRRLMLDPRDVENGRERYTADLLTQYLKTAEGQLAGAEDRHDLLFRREDMPSEDFTKAANDGLSYAWETETESKRVLARTKRRIIVDGTAAVRVRFDPTCGCDLGPVPLGDGQPINSLGEAPIPTTSGQPLVDAEQARAFVAERQAAGAQAQFKAIKEGRIVLDPLSVFNLLVPPGVEDEHEFQWEAVIRALPIDTLIALYGDKAKGLQEEPLAALEMLGVREQLDNSLGGPDPEQDGSVPGKLQGQVAVVSYYERPCRAHPKGRVVTYAGNRLLDLQEQLPVCRPNGDYSSGIAYFHYWKVEGRFFGRGLIEPGKKIQRLYNKRASQEHETIDRGQPYMLASTNSDIETPREILQVVKFKQGTQPPTAVQGIGPGPWMRESKESLLQDLERSLGIRATALGDNPTNVTSYAQLALLVENNRTKIDPIIEDFQENVKRLEEYVLWNMRRYWPSDKLIALAGEDDMAEAVEFKASQLPSFFLLQQAETTRPRSEAAEQQLISDIYQDSLATQAPLPLQWKLDSIKAGKALPLPDDPKDVQLEKAKWQNGKLAEGVAVQAMPWDDPSVHLPEHNELRIECEMAQRDDLVQLIGEHIAQDEALAQQAALAAQAAQAQAMAAQAQAGAQTPQPAPQPQPGAPQ